MNLASEPKSTPFDLIAAKTLCALLRGVPGAHTNQRLSLPEASCTKGKSALGEHPKIPVHGSMLLCAGAVKRGGYRAGMLGLREAHGAQDGGQAAATCLHPGGQTLRHGHGAAGSQLTGG